MTQERLVTDRFSKAAGLLANKDNSVRIAAIYSLERIAKDSPKDHWTIMELLSAYVLERSPLSEKDEIAKIDNDKASKPNSITKKSSSNEVTKESPKSPKPIANDVQAALTVIVRRESGQDQGKELDLSRRDLSSADLSSADLSRANLSRANLFSANLFSAILNSAILFRANLSRANLFRADLNSANLIEADLSGAFLFIANLSRANLNRADLSRADLSSADLSRADLRGAVLSLADLSSAILLNTDLREAKNLTQTQLENKEPPLICNSPLPQKIKIDLNRDCDQVAAALHKRYPDAFSSLDQAEKFVQQQRQKKWD